MNRDWVLSNLREAQEAIGQTIREIETTPDYDFGEFVVDLGHVYHHVNCAWNARDATPAQVENMGDQELSQWGRFPPDLPLVQG